MKAIHFNSTEDVSGYLAQALGIVDGLELEDDLRVPAFLKAADLLAAKQVFFTQAETTPDVLVPVNTPTNRRHQRDEH